MILDFGPVVYLWMVFLFIVFFRGALERLGRVPLGLDLSAPDKYADILPAAKWFHNYDEVLGCVL